MSTSKKIYSVLMSVILTISFMGKGFAEDTCAICGSKNVRGAPSVGGLDKLAMIVENPKKADSPFLSYLDGYCMKYTHIEKTELNQMIRDLKETPYEVDAYFTTAGCKPQKVGGIKSPMIQLTAEDACYRAEYPQIIHKYYTVKRKDPKMWLEVVNAKNSNGETYLDYIEALNQQNTFRSEDTKECANKLIAFACSTGAVYSKYSNKTCPTSI